jgi:acyl-CoA dehydrogenase
VKYGNRLGIWDYCASIWIYGGGGLDFHLTLYSSKNLQKGISGPGFSLHSDIVAPYLLKYGTEAQKQKYLPQMAKGEMITAIGMTEPNVGVI